ncbi:M15 family metallopeptidase [Sanguibacter suaedae]|uniref:M15 family metallopeptidase n=1 Tax=Sanguibacter suaedae TaxID=2795737 RepID=A0A934I1W5_9MICO|nr:M15 family metallopeptidase [Sanguibacter suaedae]MBI9113673.1 M15 family metallopeptidase [Sanguibacter suaedae]
MSAPGVTAPVHEPTTGPRRVPRRPRRRRVAAAVVVLAVLVALGAGAARELFAAPSGGGVRLVTSTEPTAADGRVPGGEAVSPFDDTVPAIARLDPDLLAAVREAATAMEADGRPLHITSGWRSPEYQQWLQDDALRTTGSAEEASRLVASPEGSAHVTGDAVDIGPYPTAELLSRRGAQYGLCQVYANEIWHFELRPDAPEQGCPEMYDDPSQDPRAGQ